MTDIKIAYFNKLGKKELLATITIFKEKHPNTNFKLIACNHNEAFTKLKDHKVDIVINDLQDEQLNFHKALLTTSALIAVVQKGSYAEGMQTIEKDALQDLTCLLVASPTQETEEFHSKKDILQIRSNFIAANSFAEAAVLVSSGSGYFIINENTVNLISNDTLQKLFLINKGKQMTQRYYAFWHENNPEILSLLTILKQEFKK